LLFNLWLSCLGPLIYCFQTPNTVKLFGFPIFRFLRTWWHTEKNKKQLIRSFDFRFQYISDVISLNNSRFGDFVDRIYPIELEIKDTIYTARSASYFDLHQEIDSKARLRTKLYFKRDDFNFSILNFPFMCSNMTAAPVYEVNIHNYHVSKELYLEALREINNSQMDEYR